MHTRPPEMTDLERDARRIVGMICSESVPANELDDAIADLRRRTETAFPGSPRLFDATYGRRFQRLRTRFRPAPGLF
jgi:hypothetical protein